MSSPAYEFAKGLLHQGGYSIQERNYPPYHHPVRKGPDDHVAGNLTQDGVIIISFPADPRIDFSIPPLRAALRLRGFAKTNNIPYKEEEDLTTATNRLKEKLGGQLEALLSEIIQ